MAIGSLAGNVCFSASSSRSFICAFAAVRCFRVFSGEGITSEPFRFRLLVYWMPSPARRACFRQRRLENGAGLRRSGSRSGGRWRSWGGSRWSRTIRTRQNANVMTAEPVIAVASDQITDRVADYPWDEVQANAHRARPVGHCGPCPAPCTSTSNSGVAPPVKST